ncbi:MAG: DUF2087 domain-containing protein [Aristaeellaceae bacterium]
MTQDMLRSFLDAEGRVTQFPTRRKKQLAVLQYLAGKLTPGRVYTEREINEALLSWHTFRDPATLRRELYDYHFLNRTPDGRAYELAAPQPTLEELGL